MPKHDIIKSHDADVIMSKCRQRALRGYWSYELLARDINRKIFCCQAARKIFVLSDQCSAWEREVEKVRR